MTDSIERTLELAADLATVWQTVTDPDGVETWLAEQVAWELVPGGDARFVVDGEAREGWVEEVCAPEHGEARLTFWWQADGEPASRVDLALTEIDRGTRLRVCEARPLELLDIVGISVDGAGGTQRGPAMIAA